MGLFSYRKKRAAEKEAARKAEIERAAEDLDLRRQREASAQVARKAAMAKEVEKQEMVLQEMQKLQGNINIWEKKVQKLEDDKKTLMTEMVMYKKKGVALPQPLMKKFAKVKKDIELTQAQLETLQNKHSGIEQAHANEAVVTSVAEGNIVLESIKPTIEKVEDVLGKADEQTAELEETSNAFLVSSAQTAEYDEDDIEAELVDFQIMNEPDVQVGQASTHASALPTPPSIKPTPFAASSSSAVPSSAATEDAAEAEMRRLEQSMAV